MSSIATIAGVPAIPANAHATLAQPAMLRGASMPMKAPTIATHYTHRVKARPVRATAVPASESTGGSGSSATAAHVLQDVADGELSKRLQSRLATLGIGANTVKVEVRANSSSEGGAGSGRAFTLTLSGKLPVNLGSLFNILVYGFLKQHTQIVAIERRVTFVPSTEVPANTTVPQERCVDSAPILALKVKHVAKLLAASTHTVVYTGDHLLQGSLLLPVGMTAPGSTPPADAAILTELSAPHPPALLTRWVRAGFVRHIINENTEGWFNPKSKQLGGAGMSDDDVCSVHSSSSVSSCSSDEEKQSEEALTSDQLSELYGNKFKEVCSAGCGSAANSAQNTVYFRDFEVRQPRFHGMLQGQSGTSTEQKDPHLTGRSCTYCSAPLRDTLVDWNESLPRGVLQKSVAHASQAEVSLVLGSSLKVAPTCDMPQLSSPSAPMILVGPYPTGKDIEALESGGVLIRKEPVFVLDLLEKERRQARRDAAPKAVQAKIVRRGSGSGTPARQLSGSTTAPPLAATTVTPALAIPRIDRVESCGSSTLMPPPKMGLFKTWSKSSHPHGATPLQVSTEQSKRTHNKHLLHFAQRRGAQPNHGLSRPSMSRSATAPHVGHGVIMRASAALPPFPSLEDDEDETPIPAASAPSRAWSEEPSPKFFSSLALGTPRMPSAAMLFPSTASSMQIDSLPSLPTVSSPVFMASRGSSLSPPQWTFNITNNSNTTTTIAFPNLTSNDENSPMEQ